MSLLRSPALVGAYVCPRGVFTIECKRSGSSIAVERRFEVSVQVDDPASAAEQVIRALRSAGIASADVAIAIRGFGVAHHVLQMPPAKDDILAPIIDREIRRLEPQMGSPVVGWMSLPPLETGSETTPQRTLLATGAPADTAKVLDQRLREAGYRLLHLTALPVAMQRLLEEFDEPADAFAFVAPLPDGPFIGFSLNGALRLIVEPPPQDAEHEAAALAEEVELGAMFVRQQFRRSQMDRITLVGSKMSLTDAETALTERLHVPTNRLGVRDLSPAALAALGAVLDAQAAVPVSLGGVTIGKREANATSRLASISFAALLVVALLGAWVLTQLVRERRATAALQSATRRVEQDAFGLASLRSTADQRRMVRDAVAALRLVANDRAELQQTLSGVGAVARPPIRLDSLSLIRGSTGWTGRVSGTAAGATNARAVQALHDLYRELPQRLSADSLRLEQLIYVDVGDTGPSSVRFQLSFGIPSARRD